MSSSRKYLLTSVVAAMLIGVPTAVQAATHQSKGPLPAARAGTHHVEPHTSCSSAAPVRTVRSGEVVKTVGGAKIWLTEQGKFWQSKGDSDTEFRSVVDGNIDRTEPGVSLQVTYAGTDKGAEFLSGLYYGPGTGSATKVVLEGTDGKTCEGSLLTLPGDPQWGVWFVDGLINGWDGQNHWVSRVSVLDGHGEVLTSMGIRHLPRGNSGSGDSSPSDTSSSPAVVKAEEFLTSSQAD